MRMLAPLLAVAIVANGAFAQQPINERRPVSRDGTIKITNAVGSVRVVGWDRDTVAISGSLGAGAARLAFETNARETRLRVVLDRDARDISGTDLVVQAPRHSQVAVRTSSADIDVSHLGGSLDLESVSGSIRVSGTPRMVYVESAGGDIDIEVSTKVVRAKSIDGNVTVRVARGYVEVSTVSGSATVLGERVWEGEMTTVSGDIHFTGDFDPDGSFSFESHGGDIELVLPDGINADFEITTLRGVQIRNDFAPARDRSFSVGRGGTQIRIKSFKGDVFLRKDR